MKLVSIGDFHTEAGATLADAGVISSGTLRAPQARMLLAAAISTDTDPAELFPDAD